MTRRSVERHGQFVQRLQPRGWSLAVALLEVGDLSGSLSPSLGELLTGPAALLPQLSDLLTERTVVCAVVPTFRPGRPDRPTSSHHSATLPKCAILGKAAITNKISWDLTRVGLVKGQDLRELRERFGFSVDQVAMILNVSPASVRRMELAEEVDQVTWAKYERAVAILRGLLRDLSKRLTRAMREEMAPV